MESFQLQPGALGEVSNTRVHARLKKKGGEDGKQAL